MADNYVVQLEKEMRKQNPNFGVLDLRDFLRTQYQHSLPRPVLAKMARIGTERYVGQFPPEMSEYFSRIAADKKLDWADFETHVRLSATSADELKILLPLLSDSYIAKVAELLHDKEYLLSFMPLNTYLPGENAEWNVQSKYLPPLEDEPRDEDPYGLGPATILDTNGKPILTQKFGHSILENVIRYCPGGCWDCYKFFMTHLKDPLLKLTADNPIAQTKKTVEHLNEHPEIYDAILSGGEPSMMNEGEIKDVLNALKEAKHLKFLRFCTGALTNGFPMKIDDKLLDTLRDFDDETGIRVTLNTHYSSPHQLTPEALVAMRRVKEHGFKMYAQVPLHRGINTDNYDLDRTVKHWIELVTNWFAADGESYKFIVDMAKTPRHYVPIEVLAKAYSAAYDTHEWPELPRPKTLSILTKEGNIIIDGGDLAAMEKEIDTEKRIVTYYIPKSIGERTLYWVYEEPLMEQNSDPLSLEQIKRSLRDFHLTRKK